MTTEEKLKKIKTLADKMYSRMQYLTTDTKPIREAMEEYHQFVVHEYHDEESVSEELEEASKEWLAPKLDKSYANYGEAKMMELTKFDGYAMLDAIEFGAKWQKQQDDKEIKMVRELLADFDKHCDEYHEAGFKHGQEALMKDAVVSLVTDVIIHNDGDEVKYSVAYPICKRPFNKGDKVKVIVIKED